MIIARSPLRISLGGGGTDLSSYYQDHSGLVMAAAIDKYVYITLHQRFVPKIFLNYSHTEEVDRSEEIKHPLIRETLRLSCGDASPIEITSIPDIPPGTALRLAVTFP